MKGYRRPERLVQRMNYTVAVPCSAAVTDVSASIYNDKARAPWRLVYGRSTLPGFGERGTRNSVLINAERTVIERRTMATAQQPQLYAGAARILTISGVCTGDKGPLEFRRAPRLAFTFHTPKCRAQLIRTFHMFDTLVRFQTAVHQILWLGSKVESKFPKISAIFKVSK